MRRKCIICAQFFISNRFKKSCSEYCAKERTNQLMRSRRSDPEYRRKQAKWNEKWALRNRDKVRKYHQKYQAKRRNFEKKAGYTTTTLRKSVYARDNHRCLCCGSKENLSVDHIKPMQRGGETVLKNLQTLCVSCNASKQDKIIDYRGIRIFPHP